MHMSQYGGHAPPTPPRHIPPSMQHIKPKPKRARKAKPPASLSKLHRPLVWYFFGHLIVIQTNKDRVQLKKQIYTI